MSGMIQNTVKLRFPASASRPSWNEIADFLKKLDSDVNAMETVYKMGDDRSLCIKYTTSAGMEEALRRNLSTVKFKYSNGKAIDVHMSPAGINVRYVRIFDVPPEVSDDVLSSVFGCYGKVERVIREKFSSDPGLDHIFNGVRGLYIDMEKAIPLKVDVLQWKAKVFYEELKNKCFLCNLEGHQRSTCPKRNQLVIGKQVAKSSNSYAGVVVQTATTSEELKTVEIPDDDIIEVDQPETVQPGSKSVVNQKQNVEPVVYRSDFERELAENWAKHEEQKRKRQEEYRKHEKSMQRRYQEDQQAKERAQKEHWEKYGTDRKSRQENHQRESSLQRKEHLVKEQIQSPPKKNSRIQ